MPLVIFEAGAILVMARYIEQKTTNGVWYFRRRVPRDVQRHYPKLNKRGELYFSLQTKDRSEAVKFWEHFSAKPSSIGSFIDQNGRLRRKLSHVDPSTHHRLSQSKNTRSAEQWLRTSEKQRI